MKISKLILVFSFLFLFAGTANSQKRNGSDPFFFIQVADPQFGFFEDNKGFAKETELYEKAVAAINKLAPDFVVLTGDLVHNRKDPAQIAEFKRITNKINSKIPVYFTPGNHDIGNTPAQADIDTFISEYGSDKFSFTHKKSAFIGLNSCIIKANTPDLEHVQFDWLKNELSKYKEAKHIVLFCHHPFFVKTFDEEEFYFNIPPEKRTRYLALFLENKVDALIAGHLHENAIAKYKNLEVITTSAVGKPLGEAPSGIRVVKVYPDRIESKYYSLDEIPDSRPVLDSSF